MSDIQQRKLGNLCTISSSKRIYAHEYVENGVPFYRSKEIIQKHNGDEINTELFITEERYTEIKEKFGTPSSGDMLMTSVGTLGVPYIVQPAEKFYFKDGNLTWYKDFSDELDSKYLFYLMDSEDGKELIKTVTIGSSQAALTIDGMKGLMIPCPTKEQQKKIVKTLIAYDNLIENNNRRIAILEEMAQRLYREWFVHFRFPGHEDIPMVESELGMIPEGWHVSDVESCCSILRRGISPKYNDDATGIVINQKCIRDFSINLQLARNQEKAFPADLQVKSGDVLINSTGVGTLGRVAQMYEHISNCTIDSHVTLLRPDKNIVYYMGSYFREKQDAIMDMGVGSTGQTELNRDKIKGLPIFIPDGDTVYKYEKYLHNLMSLKTQLHKKNATLRKTRDHLLPCLISGDIDVSKIEI